MSLFVAELSHPEERGRLAVCLQLAGLAAAGMLIARTSPIVPWSHLTLAWLAVQSTAFSAFAWLTAAALTLGLYVLCDAFFYQDWSRREIMHAVTRTAAAAVWFVPATVLASVSHPGALAAALVLVYNVTRLAYGQWRLAAPRDLRPPVETGALFTATRAQPLLVRDLAPRLIASVALQASVAAVLLHEYRLARAFFYATTAMITMLVMSMRDYRPETGSSIWRAAAGLVLSLLLAGGLTVSSLAPQVRGSGSGGSEANGAPYPTAPSPETGRYPQPPDNPNGESFPTDTFPGVILWPEIRPVPTLIAPIPSGHGGVPMASPQRPFVIPFSGEYWMYRWPYARPPQNSYLKRGNPASVSFRTTDHRPLQMEAHHKLDQAIDLRCCSHIQVGIRNSDRQPGAVALELVLIDSEDLPARRQSLGRAAVVPANGQESSAAGVLETLEFTVPANAAMEEFNEFQVIFLRDAQRMDKSPKIAIERFVLVPR